MKTTKIEEFEWQNAITERRLEIVGKLAACITHQLKQPIIAMGKNFANSKYTKTIKKIQRYIDRIEHIAIVIPDEDAEDINDYIDVTIRADKMVDNMKRGRVMIPIFAGEYLKKRL